MKCKKIFEPRGCDAELFKQVIAEGGIIRGLHETYEYDDGGRFESGFVGEVNDCACRAIAIATGKPYRVIYAIINAYAQECGDDNSSARKGVSEEIVNKVLVDFFGWYYHPQQEYEREIHLRKDELPKGIIVCNLPKHIVTAINGMIHDISNPKYFEDTPLLGYYSKSKSVNGKRKNIKQDGKKENSIIVYCRKGDGSSRGIAEYCNRTLIVKKGTTIAKELAPSCTKATFRLRETLMNSGVIENYIFTKDYPVSNPSTCASMILGSSRNGWDSWKDEYGNTLARLVEKMNKMNN